MCGRYAFFSPGEAVTRLFGLLGPIAIEPRYNIAPMQRVAAVRMAAGGERSLVLLRWGLLPHWARDVRMAARTFNARAETVATKPAFRDAFRRRRCLVLADGWYEWQVVAGGKQPWFVHRRDGAPFGMAGLWASWQSPEGGEAVESCTIVTAQAAPSIRGIHDRMPAVIAASGYERWLDPAVQPVASLEALLRPDEDAGWMARRVGPRVNSPRNEGPELIDPVA